MLASQELARLPVRTFPLRPLHREALRTVIEAPVDRAGIGVDGELVDRLVDDTASGQALPLLAFTLAQLADGVGRGDRLSAARYNALGGVQGTLTRQADAALADAMVAAGGRSRTEVIAAVLRLVTVDEQGRPTRWRVHREQLPAAVAVTLDPFVDRRLVTTDTDHDAVVVEVAHEAFLSAWPPLDTAIKANTSALRARRAVEQAAADWHSHHRSPSRLWERSQLTAAVTDLGARIQPIHRPAKKPMQPSWPADRQQRSGWLPGTRRMLVTNKVDLSQQADDFLYASIRRDRRRRQRATTILSLLLVLAPAAAGIAFIQRNTAQQRQKVAVARGLVAQADAARNTDPRTALQLGIAAHRIHNSPETQASLVNTLTSTYYAGTLTGHTDEVDAVAFAPNGHTLATASLNDTVRLWEVADPARPHPLGWPRSQGVGKVAASLS